MLISSLSFVTPPPSRPVTVASANIAKTPLLPEGGSREGEDLTEAY